MEIKKELMQETTIDWLGNITKTIKHFNSNQDISKIRTLQYDSTGEHVVCVEHYYYNRDNLLINKLTLDNIYSRTITKRYNYNSNNKLTSIENLSQIDGDIEYEYVVHYAYNSNDQIESIYNVDSKFQRDKEITNYQYDENGNVIETTYMKGDRIITVNKYLYDEKGNKIEHESIQYVYQSYDLDEYKLFTKKYTFEYDDNNNCILEKDNDDIIIKREYDKNGNCISLENYSKGYECKQVMYYDSNNDKTLLLEYDLNSDNNQILSTTIYHYGVTV